MFAIIKSIRTSSEIYLHSMLRKKGLETEPQKDFPDSYYAPESSLLSKIPSERDATSIRYLRLDKFIDAYKNVSEINSETLRARANEAMRILAQTLRAYKKNVNDYAFDLESGAGHYAGEHSTVVGQVEFATKVIDACQLILESIKEELKRRKEPVNDISVSEGIRMLARDAHNEAEAIRLAAPLQEE